MVDSTALAHRTDAQRCNPLFSLQHCSCFRMLLRMTSPAGARHHRSRKAAVLQCYRARAEIMSCKHVGRAACQTRTWMGGGAKHGKAAFPARPKMFPAGLKNAVYARSQQGLNKGSVHVASVSQHLQRWLPQDAGSHEQSTGEPSAHHHHAAACMSQHGVVLGPTHVVFLRRAGALPAWRRGTRPVVE